MHNCAPRLSLDRATELSMFNISANSRLNYCHPDSRLEMKVINQRVVETRADSWHVA